MGKKIVCESCGTIFPFEKAKDMTECPVCGSDFDMNSSSCDTINKDEFDNPDLYFYSIDSDMYDDPNLWDVWCQCTSCRKVNTIAYDLFDTIGEEFLILKKGLNLKCEGCGKPFTKIIVPKRPDGWRKLNAWEKDAENIPKCPTCSSTNIRKLSATSKLVDVAVWGVLSRKAHKQWHCDNCGSEW